MKKVVFLFLLALAACSSGTGSSGTAVVPGQGAIAVNVTPNPIVATRVSGETYDFPFEVIVREVGGRAVQIQRVTATVRGPGGFALATESWDAARIQSMGYQTRVAANGELRYRFAPRKAVPDDRLFGGVSADLRVDATDEANASTSATTNVTVTR